MHRPLVSIFMLTYNQEDYIGQAIEGVLMQETDFKFELVIGEDCSFDRTREICLEFARRYPDRIRLILNEKNIGLMGNYINTYKNCNGKYVAICDGDDYWIDRKKLDKQVQFLEDNSSHNLVYSGGYNLLPNGDQKPMENFGYSYSTSFRELVMENFIPSVTVMFKREALPLSMEEWMKYLPFGDWPTYLFILRNGGKIGYLKDRTAVYRKNFGTSTALRKRKSEMGEINLHILENLLGESGMEKNRNQLENAIYKYQKGLMASYNREKEYLKSLKLLFDLFPEKEKGNLIKNYFYSLRKII